MEGETEGLIVLPQRTQRATEEEMADSLTEQIISASIEVHRILGPALLESIYEEALCYEFSLRGIPFERQKEVDVLYKDKAIKGQRLDSVPSVNWQYIAFFGLISVRMFFQCKG